MWELFILMAKEKEKKKKKYCKLNMLKDNEKS